MALRPESSVSVEIDEFGELVFAADRPGPVIHRTPEELGIPRVIQGLGARDEGRKKLDVRPDFGARPGRSTFSERRAKKDAPRWERYLQRQGLGTREEGREKQGLGTRDEGCETAVRVVRGVAVRMPANAVMGAEMIDLLADEKRGLDQGSVVSGQGTERENEVTANNFDMNSEANQAILACPVTTPAAEIAKKLGVPVSRIYGVRWQARKEGKLPTRERGEIAKAVGERLRKKATADLSTAAAARPSLRMTARRSTALARMIEVDAQRAGTAAALIDALAKRDGAQAAVQITLTAAEVGALFGKLSEPQRSAFLAGGVKAALLA